ncbi:MAG: four helix bundle protein [Clostridia bacterium]|nr:four helix bundle protein [Clostridia bacterium]
MNSYKDLDVWKKSMDLVLDIYNITSEFPQDEKYGLSSQMKRAAVSIPSNIAEGQTRHSYKEFIHFLLIARGSCAELETQVLLCERLGLIEKENGEATTKAINEINRMINGLINNLNLKIKESRQ